jgi:hypothetical protein
MISKTEQIRALNDALRQNFRECTAVMTVGVAALGAEAVARVVKTMCCSRRRVRFASRTGHLSNTGV